MEPNTPFRLDGKVALITGGASGIGECTSRAFSHAGASIIVADIDTKKAEALAAELPGSRAMHCDITSEESVKHVLQQVPHLDILVNNAGIGLVGGVTETELSDFERAFKVAKFCTGGDDGGDMLAGYQSQNARTFHAIGSMFASASTPRGECFEMLRISFLSFYFFISLLQWYFRSRVIRRKCLSRLL